MTSLPERSLSGTPREHAAGLGWLPDTQPSQVRPHGPHNRLAVLRGAIVSGAPGITAEWLGQILTCPLAWFEGAGSIMAHDLQTMPTSGVPVQLIGNCHAANFHMHWSAANVPTFDVAHFDDTVQGPWEWDLMRLAVGLVLAGRHTGYGAAAEHDTVRACVQSYTHQMARYAAMRTMDVLNERVDAASFMKSGVWDARPRPPKRRRKKMAIHGTHIASPRAGAVDGRSQIIGAPPTILRLDSEWQEAWIRTMYSSHVQQLSGEPRFLHEQYQLIDVAQIVSRIACRPHDSFLLLLKGGSSIDTVFLSLTEAGPSVLDPPLHFRDGNHGERVVAGQRWLQASPDPFLGCVEDASGRQYMLRQVRQRVGMPVIEDMSSITLIHYAGMCGWAVARAHARSGNRLEIVAAIGDEKRFADRVVRFAEDYAGQVERDYRAGRQALTPKAASGD